MEFCFISFLLKYLYLFTSAPAAAAPCAPTLTPYSSASHTPSAVALHSPVSSQSHEVHVLDDEGELAEEEVAASGDVSLAVTPPSSASAPAASHPRLA